MKMIGLRDGQKLGSRIVDIDKLPGGREVVSDAEINDPAVGGALHQVRQTH